MTRDKNIPLPVTEKRGRGRPRKPDAMSNAQRQAAFRARRKAVGKAVTVSAKEHDRLVLECEQLREELAQARREIAHRPRRDVGGGGGGRREAASAVLVRPLPADDAE